VVNAREKRKKGEVERTKKEKRKPPKSLVPSLIPRGKKKRRRRKDRDAGTVRTRTGRGVPRNGGRGGVNLHVRKGGEKKKGHEVTRRRISLAQVSTPLSDEIGEKGGGKRGAACPVILPWGRGRKRKKKKKSRGCRASHWLRARRDLSGGRKKEEKRGSTKKVYLRCKARRKKKGKKGTHTFLTKGRRSVGLQNIVNVLSEGRKKKGEEFRKGGGSVLLAFGVDPYSRVL